MVMIWGKEVMMLRRKVILGKEVMLREEVVVMTVVIIYITLSLVLPIFPGEENKFVSNPIGDSTLTVASSTKIRYLRK